MDNGVKTTVVGAGIVGLATAMQLQRDGRNVRLIDRQAPGTGTSYGNAGIFSVGSFAPVGAPGLWRKVPGMLADPLGPLTIRWGYFPMIAPWLLRMLRYSSEKEYQRLSKHIVALSKPSFDHYKPLLDAASAENLTQMNGSLYMYESDAAFARAREHDVAERRRYGVRVDVLDGSEVRQFMPSLQVPAAGALLCPDAGFVIDPLRLSQAFADTLQQNGAEFIEADVAGFDFRDGAVAAVETDGRSYAADNVVIAAGAFSKKLTRMLGYNPPLDTERGYHVMLPNADVDQKVTALAPELGMAITPMERGLRLAGTVEFGGLSAPPNMQRADRLLQNGERLFGKLNTEDMEKWMGYRPSLPDSLPVISRSPAFSNAYFAFGHGHLGLTQAAITGRIVADMMAERTPIFDITPFRSDRF